MTQIDDDTRRRAERARRVGLFRYELIQEVIDPALSTRARGRLVRALAEREHTGPFGAPVRVSRHTIDRWARDWRSGGFEALVPRPARVTPRTPAEVLELATALKRENPARTAAQVARILRAQSGWAPSERTLQRHFERLALQHGLAADDGRAGAAAPAVFGRFEADRCNELWVGDALHGPHLGGRKTYLFAFLDDRSRAVMAARFGFHEDTVRLAVALRPALAARGVPGSIYVDNGSSFVDSWLLRACASLGIKLVHSTPGRPQGRGKIERFFRSVREQFLVELTAGPPRPGRRPGRAEPAVHRMGRNGLPPGDPLRDRGGAAAPLVRRSTRPAAPPQPGAAARGVLMERVPHRHQDRDGVAARQPLPGRRAARRTQGRAGLRPLRPDRDRGPLRRAQLRRRGRVHHRPPLPPQGPTRTTRPRRGTDRDRLPAPDRHRAHRSAATTDQLRRPHRPAPRTARPAHRRPGRRRRGGAVDEDGHDGPRDGVSA